MAERFPPANLDAVPCDHIEKAIRASAECGTERDVVERLDELALPRRADRFDARVVGIVVERVDAVTVVCLTSNSFSP